MFPVAGSGPLPHQDADGCMPVIDMLPSGVHVLVTIASLLCMS